MTKFLYGKGVANSWFDINLPKRPLGVLLRQSNGTYSVEPQDLPETLVRTVARLGVQAAFAIATDSTEAIFDVIGDEDQGITLGDGLDLQVVDSMANLMRIGLAQARRFPYAALIRSERILLVWHDEADKVLQQAVATEEELMKLIWGAAPFTAGHHTSRALTASSLSLWDKTKRDRFTTEVTEISDLEEQELEKESLDRPVKLYGAIIMACSIFFLVFLIFGYTTSHLVLEMLTDGDRMRFVWIAFEPLTLIVAMFFSLSLMTYAFQLFGPITGLFTNTRFFSSVKPNLKQAYDQGFTPPRVTIQMAVYKESLELVVMPTVRSLMAAVSDYELKGGKANIFITDDGLGYLLHSDPAAAQARIEWYEANNIGWVARPMNGENGYFRTGRFKKASNSNFCMNFANRVERTLTRLVHAHSQARDGSPVFIDPAQEDVLYHQALTEELAKDSRVKAAGNIRIGEVILMCDSDTRVPRDCLINGAAEMFLSPEVAIVQHHTSVYQVSGDFFENGATYFAKMCYAQIRFQVSNGECAPFVGHNAFVRWKALQDVGIDTGDPNYVMYWSEYHISEDFNMSIRLQSANWVTRYASYHQDEFKEQVSLTIYDEISRWERYSYGDSELLFNPIWTWLWRGPFTPLFRKFLFCDMHWSSKLSIISYMTSYYAIGSGFFYTIANYVLVGLFWDELDKFYTSSWSIFLSVVLVFWILSNVALAIMRFRIGERSFLGSLWENFRWQPMYCFYFYGLSFHVNKALIAHIVGYEMTWEMTKKEVENSNFFMEIPKIVSKFKYMYLVMIPLAGGVIYMAFFAPLAWRITQPVAIVPMALMIVCHCSLPFVLNPHIVSAVDQYAVDDKSNIEKI
ncbi:hypothetical protein G647_05712 [Cladophialophora carrionii CBS 160.54]|uniref:Uncharacterized protein n=1 Tax=Cladophialophora carrionii CBS 160.54 TaxID=1279043 RepID=V9DAP5_9EURO|nr:uncharacterized protein G647_05712 [Cladophialophora carrionii CBS 160.54]ETI23905.1 hypothetical protein G647_05712 [Cladophialophora carrionii CBS 160.54]